MNVASLELCKELYELSAWDGTYLMMRYGESRFGDTPSWLLNPTQLKDGAHGKHLTETDIPAYDLGYLLRKLPGYPAIQKLNANPDEWLLEAMAFGYHASGRGDTPEDAACKLAIELFKQGILTK